MIDPDSVIALPAPVGSIVAAAVNSIGIEQVAAVDVLVFLIPPVPAILILPQLDNVWAFKSNAPPDCTSI